MRWRCRSAILSGAYICGIEACLYHRSAMRKRNRFLPAHSRRERSATQSLVDITRTSGVRFAEVGERAKVSDKLTSGDVAALAEDEGGTEMLAHVP